MDLIEHVDLSYETDRQRDTIINHLRIFFEGFSGPFLLCDSIADFYVDSLRITRSRQTLDWWQETFRNAKILAHAIKNKYVEKELSETDRKTNLCILELEMFTAKLFALTQQLAPQDYSRAEEYLLRMAVLHRYIYLKIGSN